MRHIISTGKQFVEYISEDHEEYGLYNALGAQYKWKHLPPSEQTARRYLFVFGRSLVCGWSVRSLFDLCLLGCRWLVVDLGLWVRLTRPPGARPCIVCLPWAAAILGGGGSSWAGSWAGMRTSHSSRAMVCLPS
jgi:hypothetical protein